MSESRRRTLLVYIDAQYASLCRNCSLFFTWKIEKFEKKKEAFDAYLYLVSTLYFFYFMVLILILCSCIFTKRLDNLHLIWTRTNVLIIYVSFNFNTKERFCHIDKDFLDNSKAIKLLVLFSHTSEVSFSRNWWFRTSEKNQLFLKKSYWEKICIHINVQISFQKFSLAKWRTDNWAPTVEPPDIWAPDIWAYTDNEHEKILYLKNSLKKTKN